MSTRFTRNFTSFNDMNKKLQFLIILNNNLLLLTQSHTLYYLFALLTRLRYTSIFCNVSKFGFYIDTVEIGDKYNTDNS